MVSPDFKFALRLAKSNFFDRAAVLNAVPPAKRKALPKIGAYVRRDARSSMRRKKGASAPGRAPNAHVGLLKEKLFFSYDAINESVVVGPVPFNKGEAPSLNEFGGKAVRRRWDFASKSRRGASYTATYPARAFMGPALERAQSNPKLMDAWRDAVVPRN